MDYEKLYKEALERAKKLKGTWDSIAVVGWCEYIFPELKESEDERIRGKLLQWLKLKLSNPKVGFVCEEMKQWIAWLEKQDVSNKVSIWKHWKDGIAGNGDGKQMFLIKSHNTYNLSSCLSFECDYIELSELEKLMEKKDESKFEQCIQESDEIVTNEDGTHFNVSQLERVSKKVTDTKETAKKFLKTAGIMDKNGELADEYRPEKQGGKQGEKNLINFKAKDWYVSKVDGKIYNAKFMEKTPNNQARRLEIEKAAISATGIIEREEWFIKGAEWADENPFCVQIEKQGEKLQYWKPSEEQLEALDYAYNSCPDTEIGNRYEGVLETLIDDLYKLLKKQGEQKPQRIISAEAKEAMYDKPTWSEEDEETLGWLCTFLKEYGNPFYDGNEENVIDWLKQLKDRMKGE